MADLVVGARLAEVARASAATRCGRAGRCRCHPRSVLVHGWQVEVTRDPVLEGFPVDAANVADLVVGVVVALARAWLGPPVSEAIFEAKLSPVVVLVCVS